MQFVYNKQNDKERERERDRERESEREKVSKGLVLRDR